MEGLDQKIIDRVGNKSVRYYDGQYQITKIGEVVYKLGDGLRKKILDEAGIDYDE